MARKRSLWERIASFLQVGGAGQRPRNDPPLGAEWAAYLAKKPHLLAHEGQWVVIHGETVLGICPTYEEALRLGYERAGYVDFLVHQVLPTEPVHPLPPRPI
jgi:hypothetical protein